MSDMKERISRAIARAIIKYNGREAISPDPQPDDFADAIAEAVLEEMREPTEEMVRAAYYSALDEDAAQSWRAMIDEARK